MKVHQALLPSFVGLFVVSCSSPEPLPTVSGFQPSRYAGEWHEIARLPNSFEKNVVAAKATYSLREDGSLGVKNEGLKANGRKTSITGRATASGPLEDGKLSVRFDPFPVSLFRGDYWVLDLDPEYTQAVVGSPSRKMMWLLAKDPATQARDFSGALQKMAGQGFAVQTLIVNPKRIGRE